MTQDERWARISALFDEGVELPRAQRATWLATVEAEAGIRDELARMLAAHERLGGVLEHQVVTPPDEIVSRLRQALGERYSIERELGRGGSATVFVAHENKHGRRVALKVLNPDVAALFGAERFAREVRIAAQLAHPHILGLIDSGEANGLLYYVMPFVEGETLRTRLSGGERVPLSEALTLLRDVADALAYAHRAGVVHRDLKPENVLCVGGHAFLLDFGVALLLTPVTGDLFVTNPGSSVGTPAYMAPEQAHAEGRVDHRVDLFAWGLLAHEVLTGRLPTSANDAAIAVLCPEAPRELVALVAGCLAHEAARRIERAEHLVETLTRLMAVNDARDGRARRWRSLRWMLPALFMIAIGLVAWRTGLFDGSRDDNVIRVQSPIAVAVLKNDTGDSSLSVWGRMAGDWITQGLHETGIVRTVPWTTSLRASELLRRERADGTPTDAVSLMRSETGAATVVTGTYYLVNDSMVFRVEVADAVQRRLLGALPPVTVSRGAPEQAIELLRDRVMSSVAVLSDDRYARMPGLASHPPAFAAYRVFDDGMNFLLDQRYAEADSAFRRAFALDSTFTAALLYNMAAAWNTSDFPQVELALRQARARGHTLSDFDRYWMDYHAALLAGDGRAAYVAIVQANQLAPGSRAAYSAAHTAITINRPDEAVALLRAADPDRGDMRGWSSYWTQLTHALHLTNAHVEERVAANELRRRYPDRRVALHLQVRAAAAVGDTTAIDSLLRDSAALPPDTYWSQGGALVVAGEELMAHGYLDAGRDRLQRAVRWLDHRIAIDSLRRDHAYWLGSALYDLGEWRRAHVVLASLAERDGRLQYRAMALLAAARLGPVDETTLGPVEPRLDGDLALYRARLAAVRGDDSAVHALLERAVRSGVNGLAWVHASAWRDLEPLIGRGVSLPASFGAAAARAAPP
jgi:serine/threonine-protein kinase